MALHILLQQLEPEISDADEETFVLFSQSFPSQDLGFVNAKTQSIDINVGSRSLSITQSPGLLASKRNSGTTGAVLWRVTHLFAEWLCSHENIFFASKVLQGTSTVIELGCGSSGLLALTLGPKIGTFVATDQEYVFRLLRHNLESNPCSTTIRPINASKPARGGAKAEPRSNLNNVHVLALDWEKSSVASLPYVLKGQDGFDLVIACDCIYNDDLIAPLVDTCAEICRLREAEARPTICVIAQQLRSDSVFTAWLTAFSQAFRVWRVPDEVCGSGLSSSKGFAVHIGILKSSPIEQKKEER